MENYWFGGLRITSDFPLPSLHACQDESFDIVIRRGTIPKKVASTAVRFHNGGYTGTYNGVHVLLDYPVGRFMLRAGEEILIEATPSSDLDEVRAYLLGGVFGALCHQRGITPLHASAIDVAVGCAAFVGPSGAGKSTIVAALAGRGHQVIADDECFLQV